MHLLLLTLVNAHLVPTDLLQIVIETLTDACKYLSNVRAARTLNLLTAFNDHVKMAAMFFDLII